jgi:hypothetical protein
MTAGRVDKVPLGGACSAWYQEAGEVIEGPIRAQPFLRKTNGRTREFGKQIGPGRFCHGQARGQRWPGLDPQWARAGLIIWRGSPSETARSKSKAGAPGGVESITRIGSPILHNIKDIREVRHHRPADTRQRNTPRMLIPQEMPGIALPKCQLNRCRISVLSSTVRCADLRLRSNKPPSCESKILHPLC